MSNGVLPVSYVIPVRSSAVLDDLTGHLRALAPLVELLVVDGSEPAVFDEHHRQWQAFCRHVPVLPGRITPMGKVGGVLTGVALATHDTVVVADDDVRWDRSLISDAARRMVGCDVLRPQNHFRPQRWHTRWDTGRILINRALGGDWPGTLVVSRKALLDAGGYRGDVLFENLELVRTIRAAGGRERLALDLLVPRGPPSTRQFLDQRVRQAYDELARPWRLVIQLALAPAVALGGRRVATVLAGGSIALAEVGRRKGGGRQAFPPTAALFAPLWMAERAVTSWLAIASRMRVGGVRYRSGVLRDAATPMRQLRVRQRARQAANST